MSDNPLDTLTGPGGAFEIVTGTVNGVETQMYANRRGSLRDLVEAGRAHGDKTALVQDERRFSYEDQFRMICSLASELEARGVGKGDRVAIIAANSPEWLVTFHATVVMGAISVPLNAWWKTEELEFVLEDSGAKVVVCDPRRFGTIRGLQAKIDTLDHVLVMGDRDLGEARALSPLLAGQDAEMPQTPIAEDDYAAILYTSGTTGKPKGSIQSHRGAMANLQNLVLRQVVNMMSQAANPDPDAAERPQPLPTDQLAWLMVVPLFHVTGLFAAAVPAHGAGGKVVFMPQKRFDPDVAMRLVEDEKITLLTGVPTIVQRILDSPNFGRYELRTLTQVGYGGAPSTRELVRAVSEKMPWLSGGGATTAYGMTELAGVATANAGVAYRKYPDSCGTAMPTLEVKIAQPDGEEVPRGERGEIWVKGPTVSPGYWQRPEANAESYAEGWFRTGDIGRMNEEGFIFILDRAKDMIIRGGENIYCAEIEDVIGQFPGLADVAVIGVPHPDWGEQVKAVVVPKPGTTVEESAIAEFCSEHLADYKVPEVWEIREELLPRNPAGKILKSALRGESHSFTDEESDSVL